MCVAVGVCVGALVGVLVSVGAGVGDDGGGVDDGVSVTCIAAMAAAVAVSAPLDVEGVICDITTTAITASVISPPIAQTHTGIRLRFIARVGCAPVATLAPGITFVPGCKSKLNGTERRIYC